MESVGYYANVYLTKGNLFFFFILFFKLYIIVLVSFQHYLPSPGGSDGKESACNVGDLGSIPGLGRSPGEGTATHSSILAWRLPWKSRT